MLVNKKTSCLVIKNDGIGDLILVSGLINELNEIFEHIDLVTTQNNKEVAENIVGIRRIFYVSRDTLSFNKILSKFGIYAFSSALPSDKNTLENISANYYDFAICLRRFIRASSFFIMSNVRADKKICMWQKLTNISHKLAIQYSSGWEHLQGNELILNELTYYREVLGNYFEQSFNKLPALKCTNQVMNKFEDKNIGICIGGRGGNWPIKNWMKLIGLLDEANYQISIYGGKDALSESNKIEQRYKNCRNFVGKLSFSESVESLSKLQAFVGNETGLTHFASIVLDRVLVIYGGRTFQRFFPWPDSSNQYLLFNAMGCFDCNNKCIYIFDRYKCLTSIQPIAVYKYIAEIISIDGSRKNMNLRNSDVYYKTCTHNSEIKVWYDNESE